MARFAAIRRAIVRRKPALLQIALAAVGLAIAVGSRWLLDRGAYGAPFATFLPMIILAATFLDWPATVAVALGSFILSLRLFFDFATPGPDPDISRLVLIMFFILSGGLLIAMGQILRSIVIEAERQAEQLEMFNAELQHRVKNTLQIVSALASRASGMDDPASFYQSLSARIDALIQANEFLRVGERSAGELRQLIDMALRPFDSHPIDVEGPCCTIDGEVGLRLTMALHELATNAVKHGALSAEDGRVSIAWRADRDQVSLRWRETGGPEVLAPSHRGLGSRILVAHGPLSDVALSYDPAGLACTIRFAGTCA